ncbi:deleted in malignant brain tumors 1 protein-like [Pseudorasbora parva]|uniref:deleted in malignant brain tumors 1 protein-like n=1 Tax=Pseudorasbora parva TaxID=51549 RepID=UPI00351F683E
MRSPVIPGLAVKLVNGSNLCSGRVEILHNGIWGTVCDDLWDSADAAVVCQELGCGSVIEAKSNAYFGQGSGKIWLDDVQCSGSESTLTNCSSNAWGSHDCRHGEDAGVVCQAVKLVNGSNLCSGRVEVLHNGIWGTVCDDHWDSADAAVVCRELGCGSVIEAKSDAYFGQGSGQIWLDDVQCSGSESTLANCSSNAWGSHNCGHGEDAGVVCQESFRLMYSTGRSSPSTSWDRTAPSPLSEASVCREKGREKQSIWSAAYNHARLGLNVVLDEPSSDRPEEHGLTMRRSLHPTPPPSACSRDLADRPRELYSPDDEPGPSGSPRTDGATPPQRERDRSQMLALLPSRRRPVRVHTKVDEKKKEVCLDSSFVLGRSNNLFLELYHSSAGRSPIADSSEEGSPVSGGGHNISPPTGYLEPLGLAPEGARECEVDPVNCPVASVLEFLQDRFSAGLTLSTLKVMRPAARSRVPTWDLAVVLGGLAEALFEPLELAEPRNLTLRVAFLLAITSLTRVGDPQALAAFHPTPYVTAEEGRLHLLCLVRALRVYLEKSAQWRRSQQLLVCFSSPKKGLPASTQTISNWIVQAITMAYPVLVVPGFRLHTRAATLSATASQPEVKAVKLVNGPNLCSGRLEILHNGIWGTVCDDLWDSADAAVVCQELGCGSVIEAKSDAYFGQGSGQIWLDNVQCSGSESTLANCLSKEWGSHDCGHGEDAGVVCQAVKLVNGPNLCSGRVEILHNGIWGTVCDDLWDSADAAVVCRELGCGSVIEAKSNAYFGQGSGQIWLDNVQCSGSESTLANCSSNAWGSHDCVHGEDAGVVCQAVKLVNGPNRCSGRVEILHNGIWGTVCDDLWDSADAAVVCRELGCGSVIEAKSNAYFGQGSGQIWLDNVQCRGNESTLTNCSSNAWGSHDCRHHEDAGVVCQGNETLRHHFVNASA